MRIGIDGRYIQDYFPGIGRYTFNLAQAMIPLLSKGDRLILLRDPAQLPSWDWAALVGKRIQVVDHPLPAAPPGGQGTTTVFEQL